MTAPTAREMTQAALFARWGQPHPLPPDVVDDDGTSVVRAYAVGCEQAALEFVRVERSMWGNPARAELRPDAGWCVVVDLRDRIADMKRPAS